MKRLRLSAMVLLAGCTGIIGGYDPGKSGGGKPSSGPGAPNADSTGPSGVNAQGLKPFAISTTGARRLTPAEYDATIRDLLGDSAANSALDLPPGLKTPFDNDYTQQVASEALIDGAESLSTDLAQRLTTDTTRRKTIVGCMPTGPGDSACLKQFITAFGRRALRHPLSSDEVNKLLTLQTYATQANDFYVAVELVVRVLLQDPRFLYRIEVGLPVAGQPGVAQVEDHEMAARLSYLLWGSTPKDWLLDLADARQLSTADQVRAAAVRALTDPRAISQVRRFHALWLGYDVSPLDASLAVPMRTESDALVKRIVFTDLRAWHELLDFDQTYINDSLATLYGLPKPGSSTPKWVAYGSSGRAGILSQGSFLAQGARFGDTSPTQRGKAVRTRLLCQDIPPPPPGVVTDQPVTADGGSTCKVARYSQHATGGCAACHNLMDPIGFGLENYDTQGAYRGHDDGDATCAISGDGKLVGVGTADFNGPGQLGALLAGSDQFHQCAATQLFRFAMGRSELDGADEASVAALTQRLSQTEPRLDALLLDFVSSDSFRFLRSN